MGAGQEAVRPPEGSPVYVLQKHWARGLHYDLRLEVAGRLVSWAVPKGPSKDPGTRRLAIRMPDHPMDYALFEGRIPSGSYGAGVVMVWDSGTYEPLLPRGVRMERWIDRGFLRMILHGTKLHGLWELVRTRSGAAGKETWLWMKLADHHAHPGYDPESEPRSSLTGRSFEEIGGVPAANVPVPAAPRPGLENWARPCAVDPFEEGNDPA